MKCRTAETRNRILARFSGWVPASNEKLPADNERCLITTKDNNVNGPPASIQVRRQPSPSSEQRKTLLPSIENLPPSIEKPSAQHRKTFWPSISNSGTFVGRPSIPVQACFKSDESFLTHHVIMAFANRGRCAPPPNPPHLCKPCRLAPKHMKPFNPSCDHCAANGGGGGEGCAPSNPPALSSRASLIQII